VSIDWSAVSRHAGPEDSPGFMLWRASVEWRRAIDRALAPLKLTQPQFVVLAGIGWLTRNGDGVRQVDVGRHVGMDPNTMSQVLGGLERRKLVSRRRYERDSGSYPGLTRAGRALLVRATGLVEAVDERFFGVLGADIPVAIALFAKLFSGEAAATR